MPGREIVILSCKGADAAENHYPSPSPSRHAVAARTWAKLGERDAMIVCPVLWLVKVR